QGPLLAPRAGWPSGRLNCRGLDHGHQFDRLEGCARSPAASGTMLLEYFAPVVIEEITLLRPKLAHIERGLNVPVLEHHGIELLRHQQLAVIQEGDVAALKQVRYVGRHQQPVVTVEPLRVVAFTPGFDVPRPKMTPVQNTGDAAAVLVKLQICPENA